jgi:hypothetical protein
MRVYAIKNRFIYQRQIYVEINKGSSDSTVRHGLLWKTSGGFYYWKYDEAKDRMKKYELDMDDYYVNTSFTHVALIRGTDVDIRGDEWEMEFNMLADQMRSSLESLSRWPYPEPKGWSSAEIETPYCGMDYSTTTCFVCLDDYEPQTFRHLLKCGHHSHPECFDELVQTFHSAPNCPTCRQKGMLAQYCLAPVMVEQPPSSFPVFVKTEGGVISLEVFKDDSIEALKGQIQAKEGIPSYQLRLMFQGKLLTTGTVGDYGIGKESEVTILQPPLQGGGKRARGDAVASKRSTKESKLADVTEELGTAMMRLQIGQDAPAIREIYRKATVFAQHIARIDDPMTREVSLLSDEAIQNISDTIASNNNVDERMRVICEAIFANDAAALKETERQIQKSKEVMHLICQFAMIKQFAEPTGNISWTKFNKLMNTRIARGLAPAAAPGLGP